MEGHPAAHEETQPEQEEAPEPGDETGVLL
jgi:hypothetical protein